MGGESAVETERIQTDLERLELEAKSELSHADSKESVERARVFFLGKKGKVSEILRQMGRVPAKERPKLGKVANVVKVKIEDLIVRKIGELKKAERAAILDEKIDVSLPGVMPFRGHRHILNQTSERILDVMKGLGFDEAHGPEIEHEFYNFEALNIPANHPAREMQDTFFVEEGVVLRTHTSPVQIRAMLALKQPPIRVVSFGKVYRRDQDVTHSPMFHQIEGLYVDKKVTFADLKGTLTAFVQRVFSKGAKIRLRPSFFPFTEPSCEVDMGCFACNADPSCRLCKGTGWIEILGAGMVDPEVFKSVGLDPEEYTGFAFGMGVERIAMIRHGIFDIRMYFDNDLRFLTQF